MEHLLIFFIGLILGGIIVITFRNRYEKAGIIDVDHHNELVQVHLDSSDLQNLKVKHVVLRINHQAHISREEHTL